MDHGVSFCCSDEVSALVIKAAVEAEHRDAVPTEQRKSSFKIG